MNDTDTLDLGAGQHLAFNRHGGKSPGVVFLCGHGSDMEGTKALACQEWAAARGQAFVRFDYRGHGGSSGDIMDHNITSWTSDAVAVIDGLTKGPQIVVGSSLGGWIMLNLALEREDRVAGVIGIAAAPDFTEDLLWDTFDDAQKARMEKDGEISLDNPYGDEPVRYPYHLVTDGRKNLRLRGPLDIKAPVHLLQGMQDHEVPWDTSVRIAECLVGDDVEVSLVKTAGHRFSGPGEIALLESALERMTYKIAAP